MQERSETVQRTFHRTVQRHLSDFFYTGFSGESLGLLRLYFACGLLFFHVSQFAPLLTLSPTGAHFYFLQPMWHFGLLGIDSHLPGLSFFVFAVLILSTITMAVGKWTRTSILIVIVCIFYLKGVRDSFAGDVHHRYIVPVHFLFLLLLSKCGQAHSRDERSGIARQRPQEWEASWPIKALQVYCASFYFWGFLAKVRMSGWAWFGGGKIQEELIERTLRWGGTDTMEVIREPFTFQLVQYPDLLFLLGFATLVIEAGFPLIVFVQRIQWRLLFLATVTGFHLANFVLLNVQFFLLPIIFLIFFDLVPVHAWLKKRKIRFNEYR